MTMDKYDRLAAALRNTPDLRIGQVIANVIRANDHPEFIAPHLYYIPDERLVYWVEMFCGVVREPPA